MAGYAPLATGEAGGARPGELRDLFAEAPLQGNPLAVFFDGRGLTSERMQALARELNLSETVFLLPADDGSDLRARIFTPSMEMPFAGHPVLGTAVLAARALGTASIRLQTSAGSVAVEVSGRTPTSFFGRMQQPIPTWAEFDRRPALLAALGLSGSGLPVEVYCNGPRHVYVEATDAQTVAALAPDQAALLALGAVGVNCFAGFGSSWKNRMFAPGMGVAEDPATGSAAGPLALHLARHGRIEFGDEIEIDQGVEIGRPSRLLARACGSGAEVESVEVAGAAVLVAEGVFAVD